MTTRLLRLRSSLCSALGAAALGLGGAPAAFGAPVTLGPVTLAPVTLAPSAPATAALADTTGARPDRSAPTALAAADTATVAPSREGALPELHRFRLRTVQLAAGIGGGAQSVPSELLDHPHWVTGSVSPALSVSLELGTAKVRWFNELQSQPTYFYWLGSDVASLDLVHLATGVTVGGERVRVGAYGFGGVFTLGGGARLALAPWETRRGGHHGLDLRLDGLVSGGPAVRGTVMYAFTPRLHTQ